MHRRATVGCAMIAWAGTAERMPEHRRRPVVDKGKRIAGSAREKIAGEIKKEYEGGDSIRAVAQAHSGSCGFVHRVVTKSGAQLRGRGGSTRRKNS
jgi:hypothetical protein